MPGLFAVLVSFMIALTASAQSHCTGPDFTDNQIREIVRRERSIRTDIPKEYENFTVSIRRKGCFYEYTESRSPSAFGGDRFFTLNQYGVIVSLKHGY
jgi:hypothetical protein